MKKIVRYGVQYLLNILRWLDCGVNTIILFGSPYETISERAAKARNAKEGSGCVLCKLLDRVIRPGHCDRSLLLKPGDDAIIPDPQSPDLLDSSANHPSDTSSKDSPSGA